MRIRIQVRIKLHLDPDPGGKKVKTRNMCTKIYNKSFPNVMANFIEIKEQ